MDRTKGPDPDEPERLAGGEVGTGAAEGRGIPDCLIGRNADEVLQKLDAGDPLGLEDAARELIVERALLVDVERLVVRAMAQAAFAARLYRGWPPLRTWIDQQLERALEALFEEDEERMLEGGPPPEGDEVSYAFLREAHGIAAERVVAVAVVFNDLPDIVRRCYYDTFVLGKSLEECAAAGHGARSEIERHLLRALTAMATLRDPGRPEGGGLE